MFHDVRWGAEHEGRFLWVLLNSGSLRRLRVQPRSGHAARRALVPPAGRSTSPSPAARSPARACPGAMTWARAYIKDDELWMDVGRGEVVTLPPAVRDAWWEGTTRQWPFMAADLGFSQETLMAHYLCNHSPSPTAIFSRRWLR